ncbi:MAG: putative transporter [Paludibacteraceae bacterium]|jgi:putative transport protein|nr:putative transporter [Paludibacteraceae bacterium]MBO7315556.1 putative transporter [Paludibacteraceae bacterium]
MDWLITLISKESIAQTLLIYSFAISAGVLLGKIKFGGVSLGVTFVLFIGLALGHFGFTVNDELLHFIKEFGLILFIFSIGLQVGPGFFSSFKKDGMLLNALAFSIVLLGIVTAIVIYLVSNGTLEMPMLVGVLSGAVTNTPGLGAAQEALKQLFDAGQISEVPQIGLGYAVAYPLGVIGTILGLILIRVIFRIKLDKENEVLINKHNENKQDKPEKITLKVTNKAIFGKTLQECKDLIGRKFVISRIMHQDSTFVPWKNTIIEENDLLLVVCSTNDLSAITAFVGETTSFVWEDKNSQLVSRRIVITQNKINGKTIRDLNLRTLFGVNITRINRSGIDLLGRPDLVLQVGDRVMVVGELDAIKKVEHFLGNTLKRLNEPHLITIFFGILIGILAGSIPFYLPGMPMAAKLGLAGGPLIIAILLGRFGYKIKLITYTTQSANLMLREIGISLFLASVGISSGGKFIETLVTGNGLLMMGAGFLITIIPLLVVGTIARSVFHLNYFTLLGLVAGSSTNPPALAYSNTIAPNDEPAVAYSTVYPLTMFLRIISAQLLILLFC